ncbi:LysR family transcriptional regulator [Castellaniella sp.]|uniref:LysR family transcriptional regulator n=1 Tax=Castellaniella sp. TaxID=1955812 RepID=UPI003C743CC7
MNINQLNFKHLFYFWRVAKKGSLTHAAEQIHTSQSALSTQIKHLENRLGTPLFDRQGRHLELTATGQQVFAYAENIFGLGEQMLGWLEGRDAGATHVRVGSVSTMSRNFQVNWLRPLFRDPSILLSVDSGSLQTLIERLLRHQLDVVLANEPVASDPTRPVSSRFLGSQVISLVGRADRWAGTTLQVPEDLEDVEMAMPGTRHSVRLQFDALCFSAGVQPRLRAEIDDMTMLRLIARDSGWITVLPEVVVQDELHSGELVHVGQSPQLTEHFYAITVQHGHLAGPLNQLLSRAASGDILGPSSPDVSAPTQPTRTSSCFHND